MKNSRLQRGLPINILRGIVPVASVWGTDPTNLQNCTDGDMSTVTGIGSKVMGGAGQYGQLVFDLGIIKTVLLAGRIGLYSTAATTTCNIQSSDDNITYTGLGTQGDTYFTAGVTSGTEKIMDATYGLILTGRYAKLAFYVNGAATANAKIYSVMAYELGL